MVGEGREIPGKNAKLPGNRIKIPGRDAKLWRIGKNRGRVPGFTDGIE
jgi:hypothetical protein